jgi:hypothetical protein
MKSLISNSPILICIPACLILSGCSLFGLRTETEVRKAQSAAYQKGLDNGRAAEVRARYHQEQLAKELPPPPPPKRYYSVPVKGHTTADGIKIEDHTVTLEVVQP